MQSERSIQTKMSAKVRAERSTQTYMANKGASREKHTSLTANKPVWQTKTAPDRFQCLQPQKTYADPHKSAARTSPGMVLVDDADAMMCAQTCLNTSGRITEAVTVTIPARESTSVTFQHCPREGTHAWRTSKAVSVISPIGGSASEAFLSLSATRCSTRLWFKRSTARAVRPIMLLRSDNMLLSRLSTRRLGK